MVKYLALLLVLGVTCGYSMDLKATKDCIEDLHKSLTFPLYGKDVKELNDTCQKIKDCKDLFESHCNAAAQNDRECANLIEEANTLTKQSGLWNLELSLCDPINAMREEYLDNADCLDENADLFRNCHKGTQKCQDSVPANKENDDIKDSCCDFKKYMECFTDVTKQYCNESATVFLNSVIQELSIHIMEGKKCTEGKSSFDVPFPLPPPIETTKEDEEIEEEKGELDTDKIEETIPNNIDETNAKTEDEAFTDNIKETNTKTVNEGISQNLNETVSETKSEAATIKSCVANWILLLSFLFVLLPKYFNV